MQEVHARFVGFGAEEDEWVNVRDSVRMRSIGLDHSECDKVKVGDLVVCFQVSFSLLGIKFVIFLFKFCSFNSRLVVG